MLSPEVLLLNSPWTSGPATAAWLITSPEESLCLSPLVTTGTRCSMPVKYGKTGAVGQHPSVEEVSASTCLQPPVSAYFRILGDENDEKADG